MKRDFAKGKFSNIIIYSASNDEGSVGQKSLCRYFRCFDIKNYISLGTFCNSIPSSLENERNKSLAL